MKTIYIILCLIFSFNLFAEDTKKLNEPCARLDGWAVTMAFGELEKLNKIKYEDWDRENTTVDILLSKKIQESNFSSYLKNLTTDGFSSDFYNQVYKIVFYKKDKTKYEVITENIISSEECSITEPTIYLNIKNINKKNQ